MTQGVSWLHPEYSANVALWQRCRNCIAGSDAIKASGPIYLPMLPGADPAEYQAYKDRALFYNATARTVDGLVGSIFRNPIKSEVPPKIAEYLEDITLRDEPLDSFAKAMLADVMIVGRAGILVDVPLEAGPDSRPYLTRYCAEQIRNWRTEKVGDLTLLSLVVLYEELGEVDPKDSFVTEIKGQYRVLELRMDGATRNYVQTIWSKTKTEAKEEWIAGDTIIPSAHGQPFDFIPFVFLTPLTVGVDIERPPIADLVDVNLSHYRSSADLEHGRHFTALPTPYVCGFQTDSVLKIGSSTAWVTDRTDAKVGMLEFTGQGLGALERALAEKESKMSALGARLLETQGHGREAAETVKLRHSGENSVLVSLAKTVGIGIEMAVKWLAAWAGVDPDEVGISLNTDLYEVDMSPQEITALMTLWQGQAISKRTLYAELEKGEMTRPGVTFEQEEQEIKSGGSTGSGGL